MRGSEESAWGRGGHPPATLGTPGRGMLVRATGTLVAGAGAVLRTHPGSRGRRAAPGDTGAPGGAAGAAAQRAGHGRWHGRTWGGAARDGCCGVSQPPSLLLSPWDRGQGPSGMCHGVQGGQDEE